MGFGPFRVGCAVVLLSLAWVAGAAAASGTYKQIYKFPTGQTYPENLIKGPNGSLFGVQGDGFGTGIFELDPPPAGQTAWTYSVIYTFNIGTNDPHQPPGYMLPELLMDASGNLYFGTRTGQYQPATQTVASVVKLSPPASGQTAWTPTILYDHHSPTGPNFGSFHLTYIDSSGILYGWDDNGAGSTGFGSGGTSVFRLRPPAASEAQATVAVLTRFGSPGNEAYNYPTSLLRGADGSFYGLADAGLVTGGNISVIAFRLTPPAISQTAWTRTTIFSFDVNGATDELGPLIADRSLTLYGVASSGGTANAGYVYKLTAPTAGETAWQRSVLYNFKQDTAFSALGGYGPQGALVNLNGILVGTTAQGGNPVLNGGCLFYGCGTVFRLSAITPGGSTLPWNEAPLYKFGGGPYDGADPLGPVVPVTQTDGSLALFGFTLYGGHGSDGMDGNGTVYEFIPTPVGALGAPR